MTRITDSDNKSSPATIKLLYSYGGKIMPRQTDGKLRYVGGHTRVLAADRSVSYAELIVKFWEACGFSVNLKCKLPTEDLDVLVSVTCDEDLAAVVEEYDRVSPDAKIRAVLFPIESLKTISPVSSVASLVDFAVSSPPRHRVVADSDAGKGTQQRPAPKLYISLGHSSSISTFYSCLRRDGMLINGVILLEHVASKSLGTEKNSNRNRG